MVGECPACGWLFVERGDLERLVSELTGLRRKAAPDPPEDGRPGPDPAA